MSSDRFASLDEHELQKITEAGDSDNTKNVTTWIGFGYQISNPISSYRSFERVHIFVVNVQSTLKLVLLSII